MNISELNLYLPYSVVVVVALCFFIQCNGGSKPKNYIYEGTVIRKPFLKGALCGIGCVLLNGPHTRSL